MILVSLAVLVLGILFALGVVSYLSPEAVPETTAAAPVEPPPEPDPVLYVVITGSGRVLSAPAGIDCSSECRAAFLKDSIISLSATPDVGYQLDTANSSCVSGSIKLEHDGTCKVVFIAELPSEPEPDPAPEPDPEPTVGSAGMVIDPSSPAPVVDPGLTVIIQHDQPVPAQPPACYTSMYAYNFVYTEPRDGCPKAQWHMKKPKAQPSGYQSINPRR